ncbi:ribonuclease HIII [candidate division GN15 bacterium]|uniref:Ribonuclease n=1 Tax=candidate division GN15 bacterium TaxID=2072418 RepID=A0A855XE74_9BACT|nr:MAG: ribonuclease HIII [candidate division GN15 bacterium]
MSGTRQLTGQFPLNRIIGVDESGKGDFFGPLVVGGILIPDDDIPVLKELGVKDSKALSDNRALEVDSVLRSRYPHALAVLLPQDYNAEYAAIRNLNILLGRLHAAVVSELAGQHHADLAISDQFGKPELIDRELHRRGCRIEMKQIVRGESIPQVAAGSIIARARFLREMSVLSERAGMTLPKGAGSMVDEVGRQLVARFGAAILDGLAKKHFRNYARSLKPTLL